MAKYSIEDTTLTGIADAIRAKNGTSATITPTDMPSKIAAIDTQEDLSAEMSAQDDLIAQITAALEGKTVPSGAGKNTVSVTIGSGDDAGVAWFDEEGNYENYQGSGTSKTVDVFEGIVIANFPRTGKTPTLSGDCDSFAAGSYTYVVRFKTDGGSIYCNGAR